MAVIRINSSANRTYKKWRKLVQSRKARDRERQLLIEGERLLNEAREHGSRFHALLYDSAKRIDNTWKQWAEAAGVPVYAMRSSLYKELMDTETPQSPAAVIDRPVPRRIDEMSSRAPILLLDRIQDPGNLGTMMRTAAATGVSFVGLGSGTVDPYNPKVVRAAAGALFHLTFRFVDLAAWMSEYRSVGGYVVGTTVNPGTAYYRIRYPERVAFLLGNEGQGVQPQLLDQVDQLAHIPLPGHAESLNVATACAVLLYEVVRQRDLAEEAGRHLRGG